MSVATKLTIVVVGVVGAVFAGQTAFGISRLLALHDAEVRDDLVLTSRAVSNAAAHLWKTGGETEASAYLAAVDDRRRGLSVAWASAMPPVQAGEAISVHTISGDPPYLEAHTQVRGRPLVLRRTLGGEMDLRRSLLWTQLATALVAFAVIVIAVRWGASALVTQPTERLAEHARRVAGGDYSFTLERRRTDELGSLAKEMNAMTEQLATASLAVRNERRARTATLERLRHADRLSTVGRIASTMAHELGTPLNVVSGRASLMLEDPSPQEIRENAEVIVSQVCHMTDIIKRLLDYSRRRQVETEETDIAQLLRECVALLEPMAEELNVTFAVTAPTNLVAPADRGRLTQVLTNLLTNAIEALPRGGRIDVGASCERVDKPADRHAEAGEFICITVKDRGVGIAEDTARDIFEPFFTTKQARGGTGLGLSVCTTILREHGGWMEVDSKPGVGTTFSVFVPRGDDS